MLGDTAYEALLAKVDQSDFGGALRSVFVDDAMRHPLHFAKAGLDLSMAQTALAARAARRAFGIGKSDPVAPGDNRFADRTWEANPAFRMLAESYLSTVQWAQQLVDTSHAPAVHREKARFAVNMMLDAMAPTNVPWMNPAVLKETFETGGQSVIAGASNFIDDLLHNGGRPR